MKNLIKQLIVIVIVFLSGSTLKAQTKYLRHIKLTEYHTKAKIHASYNIDESLSGRDVHKLNTEEAGRNLQNAIEKHNELKKVTSLRYGSITRLYHEAIDKHHREAVSHYEAMKAETGKRNYDIKKVREHAKNMYLSIEKAELEHQALKYKTS